MVDPLEASSDFNIKKKVDESWKDNIEKEKDVEEAVSPDPLLNEPSFASFISTLGMQAFYSLGDFQDPKAGEIKTDLVQAKYLIDIIQMLAEKSKGNLTPEEDEMIKEALYGLKMKFVEKSSKP